MKFEQYYLECLSQASYLVGDETSGVAAVVDPRRDVAEYGADAAAAGLRSATSSRPISMPISRRGTWSWRRPPARDRVRGGGAARVPGPAGGGRGAPRAARGGAGVPGHAWPHPESTSIAVGEHAADPAPWGVLTGDTLFIGDVGRPDLLASMGVTADELGAHAV